MLIAIIIIGIIIILQLDSIRGWVSFNQDIAKQVMELRIENKELTEQLKYSLERIDSNTY